MPEVTQDIQAAEDLDQRVESLLKQMEDAAKRAADIAKETEEDPGPGPAAVPVETDLASQVDQLLAEASGGSSEAPQSIGSLDDELAKLATDLIEGDFQGEPPAPPVVVRAAAPTPARAAVSAASNTAIGDPPAVHRHPAPAVEAPKATPAVVPVEARPALWRRLAAGAGHAAVVIAGGVKRHTPTLLAYLEPIAYRIAALVSMPLRSRPALVRDAVGWVAIGTTFWASCLLVYFLFLFEPDAPHPTSAAVGLVDPSNPEAAHEPAEAEHAAPAHEETKEPAKEGGKESGGHEGGAKPEAKKASPLKRPEKNPLGLKAKAPEKKEGGGHGE